MRSKNIIIWDLESKPEKNFSGMVFLWQDHGSQSGSRHFSIPKFTETYSKEFKARYLSMIFELGEKALGKKSSWNILILEVTLASGGWVK